jgi:hypothetical protein
MTLAQYLASVSNVRWKVRDSDCGVFMADWIRELTGRDPIADIRGTYKNERQMLRIIRAEGGFEASCAVRLAAVGMRETDAPKDGDVVNVMAPYAKRRGKVQSRATGGLFVGGLQAVMTSDMGLVIAPLPLLKAWTF